MACIDNSADHTAAKFASARAVVHIIDSDDRIQYVLAGWFEAAGLECRSYPCLSAFLDADRAEAPGCIILDARADAIPCPIALGCPIVVTAHQDNVVSVIKAMKTGAVDFIERPLREQEIVAAVSAAIEANLRQRFASERKAALQLRFVSLSRRERQVMALVTAGKLNKQVGGDLGLSEITVKAHRGAAMRKMGARTLADLVRMADALGDDLAFA